MWCDVMCKCDVMWCDVMSCHVVWCDVVWCHVMWCGVMSCHVMSCHVMWCDGCVPFLITMWLDNGYCIVSPVVVWCNFSQKKNVVWCDVITGRDALLKTVILCVCLAIWLSGFWIFPTTRGWSTATTTSLWRKRSADIIEHRQPSLRWKRAPCHQRKTYSFSKAREIKKNDKKKYNLWVSVLWSLRSHRVY